MTSWLLPFLCGALTGVLSAWGIGGGTLLLVCMTLFLGVDPAQARGINLLYFLPTAAVSLFFHQKNGYLDATVLRRAIPIGTICAFIAALCAIRIDISFLKIPFGLFLFYAAITMFRQNKQ